MTTIFVTIFSYIKKLFLFQNYLFALRVKQFLNQEFPNTLIGRGGLFSWPLISSDLTLPDFLWEHKKAIVFATKPSSFEDLKAKITNVISGIAVNQLANVFRELQNRIIFLYSK